MWRAAQASLEDLPRTSPGMFGGWNVGKKPAKRSPNFSWRRCALSAAPSSAPSSARTTKSCSPPSDCSARVLERDRQLLDALFVAGDDDDVTDIFPAQVGLPLRRRLVVALPPVDLRLPLEDRLAAHHVDGGVDRSPHPVDVESEQQYGEGNRESGTSPTPGR